MMMEGNRKRGRPSLRPPDITRQWRMLYQDIYTSRQIQARIYATDALIALGRTPRRDRVFPQATWLVDWAGADRGKQGAIKWCVLEELGRMVAAGVEIAPFVGVLETTDHGLTAKEATVRLRRVRLGRAEDVS